MKSLSSREIQIMEYKAHGYTAKEIARFLGLEYRTIEIYLSNIRKKLEAKNIVHAIYLALKQNMLSDHFSS